MLRCVSRKAMGVPARVVLYSKGPRSFSSPFIQRAALAMCVTGSQTRFCSSSHGSGSALKGSSTTPAAGHPQHGDASLNDTPIMTNTDKECADGALTAEEQAAADAIIARIQGLSPEDQQLIMSAMQNPSAQKSSVMGGAGIGPATGEMVAAFTCGRCDYRMVKRFSKHAYTKGIVIVECPNCRVKHLIADNLGWIEDEARTIEDILREKGESFVRVGDGDYQVVIESNEMESPPQPDAK